MDFLRHKNDDIKKLVLLVLTEIELIERVDESTHDFVNFSESNLIIMAILDRISETQRKD